MKKSLLLIILSFSFGQIVAQHNSLWQSKEAASISRLKKVRPNNVCEGELYFSLDLNAFKQTLANAQDKFSNTPGVTIQIPNTNGELEAYQVWENSNFEPALQARFPEIRAYVGKGITDKYATLNLSISPKGIQTMVFRANEGTEFIEAYDKEATAYVLFNSSKRISGRLPFNCSTSDVALANDVSDKLGNTTLAENGRYKTFRLALSCTAEYSNYFGANNDTQVSLVLAGMNATMTRVNAVMEKDLAVHLNLIATTDQVIFYDAASDPYAAVTYPGGIAQAPTTWNTELMNTLHSTLGDTVFDIGHLFGADGGGGNAGCIGCVCSNTLATGVSANSNTANYKGSGYTSPSDAIPQGDSFDIDYVVHEMGHQLGANHTFTYNYEGTTVQVEPGSGNSIMAYAGVATTTAGVPAFNVQQHSDDLFCYRSILQIQNNLNLSSANCAVTTLLAGTNATPTAAGPGNFTIPVGTAFKLTGTATDADAGDALTYSWEQNNVGTTTTTQANSRVLATKTAGPNFKIFPATSSPTRYFPEWSRILNGNLLVTTASDATWETLSSVARTLNFTFTVRDNHAGMGQTKTAASAITVVDGGGAFAITNPTTENITWDPGATATITWNVAGTTANGINTSAVNILFSTDGGATFPIVLAAATANDGSETITIPNTTSPSCRIMIEAVGNVYFALSKNIALGYSIVTNCNTYAYSTATPIIDQAPGSYTTRTINVGESGIISDVNVINRVTHTYLSDVQTDISSPQTPTNFVKLLNRSCGNTSGTINLKFSDGAGGINCTAGGTTLQTVAPSGNLSAFNGQNAQGNWTFRVYDNYSGDTGSVSNWGLEICTQTITRLSVAENQLANLAIYPNPNKGNFNIQFTNNTSNDIKVNVYDMTGRMIFENKYSNEATFNENIQLNNAQAGVYLVSITDGSNKLTKRIIVE